MPPGRILLILGFCFVLVHSYDINTCWQQCFDSPPGKLIVTTFNICGQYYKRVSTVRSQFLHQKQHKLCQKCCLKPCLRSVCLQVAGIAELRTLLVKPNLSPHYANSSLAQTLWLLRPRCSPRYSISLPPYVKIQTQYLPRQHSCSLSLLVRFYFFVSAAIGQRPRNYLSFCCCCSCPFGSFPH